MTHATALFGLAACAAFALGDETGNPEAAGAIQQPQSVAQQHQCEVMSTELSLCKGEVTVGHGFSGVLARAVVHPADPTIAHQRAKRVCMAVHTRKNDYIISKQIIATGQYGHAALFGSVFAAATPGALFLDIGANVGLHTVQAAAAGLRVVSWEPNPSTAALLRRSLVLNCWHHVDNERVRLFNAAVGTPAQLGQVLPMVAHRGSPGMSTLADPGKVAFKLDGGHFAVDITTVDHSLTLFCNDRKQQQRQRRHPVALMKVDVEGFEAHALHGAARLLADKIPCVEKPALIHLELFPALLKGAGTDPAEVLRILASSGYQLLIGQGKGRGGGAATRGAARAAELAAIGLVPVASSGATGAGGDQTAYKIPAGAFTSFALFAEKHGHVDITAARVTPTKVPRHLLKAMFVNS